MARGLPSDAVKYRIGEMRRAFPDAEARGYENLVNTMTCDQKDRHVLAAAVRSDAAVLRHVQHRRLNGHIDSGI